MLPWASSLEVIVFETRDEDVGDAVARTYAAALLDMLLSMPAEMTVHLEAPCDPEGGGGEDRTGGVEVRLLAASADIRLRGHA